MLLMMLGVIALIFGSGAATLRLASSSASSRRPFASSPTPLPNPSTPQSKQQVLATYGRLPLMFEPNQGQTDPKVQFLARGTGYGLYLTADEAVLALQGRLAAFRRPEFRSQHETGGSELNHEAGR